jgi:hypothetical protein
LVEDGLLGDIPALAFPCSLLMGQQVGNADGFCILYKCHSVMSRFLKWIPDTHPSKYIGLVGAPVRRDIAKGFLSSSAED